jgi:hypothetical protein
VRPRRCTCGSCQTEISLDLLPRNRSGAIIHLGTRSVGRFSIERVLGEFNQPLKRRRIDNSSDATAAPR